MYRMGLGYDVHPLVEHRRLVLGGVTIPYHLGLKGHSDADVLIHAMCDAILGALARGDIGQLFPDSDPAYQDIDSTLLLEQVIQLMEGDGYTIVNMDALLILENPRIAPYASRIKDRLSQVMNIPPTDLNIKATTTEKLGFEGRGEGVAAQAVVLLRKR